MKDDSLVIDGILFEKHGDEVQLFCSKCEGDGGHPPVAINGELGFMNNEFAIHVLCIKCGHKQWITLNELRKVQDKFNSIR